MWSVGILFIDLLLGGHLFNPDEPFFHKRLAEIHVVKKTVVQTSCKYLGFERAYRRAKSWVDEVFRI
jgi:hypothetical protein